MWVEPSGTFNVDLMRWEWAQVVLSRRQMEQLHAITKSGCSRISNVTVPQWQLPFIIVELAGYYSIG